MAEHLEYIKDIQKYTSNVDELVVKGITSHLGIALRSRDASLVSCKDKEELLRVRESFLKKKLGITANDAELDKSILEICEQMKAERNKSRVTFYYLLSERFNKLSSFKK